MALSKSERRILSYCMLHHEFRRSTLQQELELSAGRVSEVTQNLLQRGVLHSQYIQNGRGNRGRKPSLIGRKPSFGKCLVVDLTIGREQIALVDLGYQVWERHKMGTELQNKQAVQELLAEYTQQKALRCIVIARPDRSAESWDWIYQSCSKTKLPVYTLNNVLAAALYYSHFVQETTCDKIAYVFLGEGVASTIMNPSEALDLHHATYQQLGHIRVSASTVHCWCGQTGCLETLCSERVWREILEPNKANKSWEENFQSNRAFAEFINRSSEALVEALQTLNIILNPTILVVAGDVMQKFPSFNSIILEKYREEHGYTPLLLEPYLYSTPLQGSAIWGFYQYLTSSDHS